MIDKYVGTSFVIMPQHEGSKVVYVIEGINSRHEFVISSDGRFVADYPVEHALDHFKNKYWVEYVDVKKCIMKGLNSDT